MLAVDVGAKGVDQRHINGVTRTDEPPANSNRTVSARGTEWIDGGVSEHIRRSNSSKSLALVEEGARGEVEEAIFMPMSTNLQREAHSPS